MNRLKFLSGLKHWLLALFPLLLLIIEIQYVRSGGMKFLWSNDPEYAYLFNGIALAHLHLPLNGVGHPGTPIQIIIAIVAWIVHLFRPGQSLWNDVMLNPELYIKVTLYVMGFINASVLFLMGRYVYRYSKNLLTAIVLQLSPFAFVMTLEVNYRLMPEAIMISIISLWLILLIKLVHEPEVERKYSRYCILFALLFGFSLSDKLTFLPYFILPLFILPNWILRLRYTALSIVSFLIFAFPVLFNFHKFNNWVTGIITHKGVYGGGEAGFVNWELFTFNLKVMVNQTYPILIPLIFLIVLILSALFFLRKRNLLVSLATGLIFLLIISYLITAKHYAFYYMTPVLLLPVFVAYLVMQITGNFAPFFKRFNLQQLLPGFFGLVLLFYSVTEVQRQVKSMAKNSRIMEEAYNNISPLLKKHPKIICVNYYGTSSIEYGLLFGIHESGRYGMKLTTIFNKLYPDTYIYYPWSGLFYQGVKVLKPIDFIKNNIDYTLYIADFSDSRLNEVLAAINDSGLLQFDLKELYRSTTTPEVVFQLKVLTSEATTNHTKKPAQWK